MAKLRTNYTRQGGSGTMIKFGLFAAIIGGLFLLFNKFSGVGTDFFSDLQTDTTNNRTDEGPAFEIRNYLPSGHRLEVVHHKYYSLGYNERYEQAEWVAYELKRDRLNLPWVSRTGDFRPDPGVKSQSANPYDYRNSGYDRGHLVPAADMAFNEEAMSETFYMSNMSPQSRNFNGGIWRELEELTRNWAKKYKHLYITTGPVFSEGIKGTIGDNEVAIPKAYYKVILDVSEPEKKGIGFLLPNEVSYEPLFNYVTSIDEVEAITGLDFFDDIVDDQLEESLEANPNKDLWSFSKQKYDLRINSWNKR